MAELEVVRFVVPGKPLTWQRASRGKYGPSYTPKDRENQMSMIRDAWSDVGREPWDREDYLSMGLRVFCKRPAGHFSAKGGLKPWALKARPLGGEHGGDLDNFVKLVKDALQVVAYHDDTQIVEYMLPFGKFYAELGTMPRTEIALSAAFDAPEAVAAEQATLTALL